MGTLSSAAASKLTPTPVHGFQWIRRAIAQVIVLVAGLGILGMSYQVIATTYDRYRYPPPGQMIDVGGYRLHLYCSGVGSPTVILESGFGGNSLDWSLVQPEVAKFTQVCAYDRAGFGWSDSGPEPRDSDHIAHELHSLLSKAGITGPYIMVGHSFGGLHARVFTQHYTKEVVGMVLVDASHEDQDIRFSLVDPQGTKIANAQEQQQLAFCQVLTPLGIKRLLSMLNKQEISDLKLPAAVQPVYSALNLRTSFCETLVQELAAVDASNQQVRLARSLGALPLRVLSHGKAEGLSISAGRIAKGEAVWAELQADLTRLSTNSVQYIADMSGHYIQLDQPDLVIRAIHQVLVDARP